MRCTYSISTHPCDIDNILERIHDRSYPFEDTHHCNTLQRDKHYSAPAHPPHMVCYKNNMRYNRVDELANGHRNIPRCNSSHSYKQSIGGRFPLKPFHNCCTFERLLGWELHDGPSFPIHEHW